MRKFDPVLGMNVAGEGWDGGALDAAVMRGRMEKALDGILAEPRWSNRVNDKARAFVDDVVKRTATAIDGTWLPTLGQVRYAESLYLSLKTGHSTNRHRF